MEKIMVLGNSGTGKTASLRNLDPSKTIIIQCTKKRLSFRAKGYTEGKNLVKVETSAELLAKLQTYEKAKVQLKGVTIVIDDLNYLMMNEFMKARNEQGFNKFTRIAYNLIDLFYYVDDMKLKGTVIFIAHTQKDVDGELEFRSVGKFVSEKFKIEGLFDTVFLAVEDYKFVTNGVVPAKSGMGMFEDEEIDNDMKEILDTYNEYHDIKY